MSISLLGRFAPGALGLGVTATAVIVALVARAPAAQANGSEPHATHATHATRVTHTTHATRVTHAPHAPRTTHPAVVTLTDGTFVATTSPAAHGSLQVPAGFPTAADTGVPSGTVLQRHVGDLNITTPGTVIRNSLIDGCVNIQADRVSIVNSMIVCGEHRAVVTVQPTATQVTLTGVELNGEGAAYVGLTAKNTVALRLNIYGVGDGVHLGRNVTLQDSYVHDLARQSTLHHDVLQTLHGSNASNVHVLHNTLLDFSANSNGNSVYHGGTGAISNIVMSGNFMDGGQYTLFVANSRDQHDIVFQGNQFGRHARYGLLQLADPNGNAVTFTANTWQGSNQPIPVTDAVSSGTHARVAAALPRRPHHAKSGRRH